MQSQKLMSHLKEVQKQYTKEILQEYLIQIQVQNLDHLLHQEKSSLRGLL